MELENSSQEKRLYEIGFILDPDLGGKDLLNALALLKEIITQKLEGNILEAGKLKKVNLAYPIKKKEKGYFGYFVFETLPEKASELKDHLKYESSVLRYILIKRNRKLFEKKEVLPQEERKEKIDEEALEKRLEEILPES